MPPRQRGAPTARIDLWKHVRDELLNAFLDHHLLLGIPREPIYVLQYRVPPSSWPPDFHTFYLPIGRGQTQPPGLAISSCSKLQVFNVIYVKISGKALYSILD
jgi:hypothetical protein